MDAAANFGSPSPSLFRHVPPEDGGHYAVALVTGDEPSLLDVSLHDFAIGIGGGGALNLNFCFRLVGPEIKDWGGWLTGAHHGLCDLGRPLRGVGTGFPPHHRWPIYFGP